MKTANEIIVTKKDGELLASIHLKKGEVINDDSVLVRVNYGPDVEYLDVDGKIYVTGEE